MVGVVCSYNSSKKRYLIEIQNLEVKSDGDSFILYVFEGKKKIKIFYFKSLNFHFNAFDLLNKKIRILVYYVSNEISKKIFESKELLLVNDVRSKYRTIILGDYKILKEKGYKCRNDAKYFNVFEKINWINKDRNLAFNLNSWRFLSPIWNEFFKTYNCNYILEIKDKILEYYDFIYNGDSRRKEFLWYDMSCALRGIHLALFFEINNINLVNNIFSNVEVEKLQHLYDLHIEKLFNKEFLSHGNHGVWQMISLRMLVISYNGEKYNDILNYSEDMMTLLLNSLINKDGFSSENSPYYHLYLCDLLSVIPEELFVKDNERILAIKRNKNKILSWFTDYDGNLFTIGDTEGKGVNFVGDNNYYDSAKKYYLLNLIDSNYIVYRKFEELHTFLCFSASNKNLIHKHADNLSFIYGVFGQNIFADGGKYSYDHSDFRKYFTSDRAHNVLCIEDNIFYPQDVQLNQSFVFKDECLSEDVDCSLGGYSSLLNNKNIFKWKRKIDVFSNGEILFKDSVVKNDFDGRVYLNLLFNHGIFISNKNGVIKVKKNNKEIVEIKLHSGYEDVVVSHGDNHVNEGRVSPTYYKSFNVFNLRIYLNDRFNQIIWSIKPLF
ncbi:heparinase II/III domain-containing protein [Acinetobacter larvae]|uniref:Heparinase II/III-like C-terminal domain-containing protein n=1 Tax=Acinetobacter larvae TaxID=1789224 RepID=A0A1B2M1Y2_9GAMM|nr:heparinase II/III family protein [Acinetobacter larvae]AOA59206.1 hypothetical protein BFG52_13135 [Acinetobacter larvae]